MPVWGLPFGSTVIKQSAFAASHCEEQSHSIESPWQLVKWHAQPGPDGGVAVVQPALKPGGPLPPPSVVAIAPGSAGVVLIAAPCVAGDGLPHPAMQTRLARNEGRRKGQASNRLRGRTCAPSPLFDS